MTVTLVAAVADNGVIGNDGDIPWRLPPDFAHFKALTLGHVLVMGRATYESIGRPLPGRTTIVLTRDPSWSAEGVLTAPDLATALRLAEGIDDEVFVVGGASVYAEALAVADVQVLTEVHLDPEGDTFYPEFDPTRWVETQRVPHTHEGTAFEFVWWERV
ncbi:dihydrofolate reductase [Marmoricola sp. OAE513]|uniref:dihydrofolate reductase n=1 Tax=Marmoricola sp. OAE513 TaxID=2817894 RepID=UPI001AE9ED23